MNGKPYIEVQWEVDCLFVADTHQKLDSMPRALRMNSVKIGMVLYNLKKKLPRSLTTLPTSVLAKIQELGLSI